jgi:hypothetical protein
VAYKGAHVFVWVLNDKILLYHSVYWENVACKSSWKVVALSLDSHQGIVRIFYFHLTLSWLGCLKWFKVKNLSPCDVYTKG